MKNLSLKILLQNNTKTHINSCTLFKKTANFLKGYGVAGKVELGIVVVGKKKIRVLNKKYRKVDQATDVLSFPQIKNPNLRLNILGDIVVCPEIAKKNALNLPHPLEKEILALIEHGIKHLLGIHHR